MSKQNNDRFFRLVNLVAGHIQKPYTLNEIVAKIESNEYNAETMLQHLLRLVALDTAIVNSETESEPSDAFKKAVSLGMPDHWEFFSSRTVRALNCLAKYNVDPNDVKEVSEFLKDPHKTRNLGKKTFAYLHQQNKRKCLC